MVQSDDKQAEDVKSQRGKEIMQQYEQYKQAQQQVNKSSGYTYKQTPTYSDKPTQTARQVMASNDEEVVQQQKAEQQRNKESEKAAQVVMTIPKQPARDPSTISKQMPTLSDKNAQRESNATFQYVKTQPKAPAHDVAQRLAALQGSIKSGGGTGEASTFLSFPGAKESGTKEVPPTSILDPLQFLGIGAGVKLAAKGGEALVSLLRSEGKEVVKIGTKDIGLNVKQSKDYLNAQRFESKVRTLPKPGSVPPPPTPKAPKPEPTPSAFSSERVNLGKGLGKQAGKGGGGGLTNVKPSSPSPPSSKPPEGFKEVKTSKGSQVLLQKENKLVQETRQIQQSKFKEYPMQLGKSQVKIIKTKQKVKQETKAQLIHMV